MVFTENNIKQSLEQVIDPEMGINIVDLGLIYNIAIKNGNTVDIKMTLTSEACPLGTVLKNQAYSAIKELGVSNVHIDLVFDPPWSPSMIPNDVKARIGFM